MIHDENFIDMNEIVHQIYFMKWSGSYLSIWSKYSTGFLPKTIIVFGPSIGIKIENFPEADDFPANIVYAFEPIIFWPARQLARYNFHLP